MIIIWWTGGAGLLVWFLLMNGSRQIVTLVSRYGSLVVLLAALLNIALVVRYLRLYRASARTEETFQTYATKYQAVQGVLREFVGRANSDSGILAILKAQQAAAAAAQSTNTPVAAAPGPSAAPKTTFP